MTQLTQEQMEEIYVQWKVGMSIPDLAEQYDVSKGKLSRALKLYRMSLNGEEDISPRQGLKAGPVELTWDDETMEKMYEQFAEGWSLADLGAEYECAASTISDNLKLWEALLDPEDRMTDEERKARERKVRNRKREAKKAETKKAAQEALEALRKGRGKK